MTLAELLTALRERDIRIWADGDRLNYRAAPGAVTAELLESLRRHKPVLIAFLKEADARLPAAPPLRIVSRDTELPLSLSQDLLWRLERLSGGSPLYNIPVVLWLDGDLDVAALRRSLQEIVRRHEVLRTTFAVRARQPIQVIQPPAEFDMPTIDLGDVPEEERRPEASRLFADEARIPFDLTRDLMLRAKLFRLRSSKYALFLNVHHIAADGWSLGILYRDLNAFYEASCNKQAPALEDLPVQFADFGAWQREAIRDEALQRNIAYWKSRLANAPALLALPTDRPRSQTQTFRGAFEAACLPSALLDALKLLSEREGVSLYMTLLAAFQILLGRYSGQTDIVVGSPIAGRDLVEVEQLIGFFVNTIVLRGDLSGDQSFREFLRRTRETTLEANAHQDLRFERLVEELKPSRDLAYNPVFQVMFSLDNTLTAPARLGALSLSVERISSGTSKFDMTLFASDTPEGLKLVVEYNTDLFDRATICSMIQDYARLMEFIVANPDANMATVSNIEPPTLS